MLLLPHSGKGPFGQFLNPLKLYLNLTYSSLSLVFVQLPWSKVRTPLLQEYPADEFCSQLSSDTDPALLNYPDKSLSAFIFYFFSFSAIRQLKMDGGLCITLWLLWSVAAYCCDGAQEQEAHSTSRRL